MSPFGAACAQWQQRGLVQGRCHVERFLLRAESAGLPAQHALPPPSLADVDTDVLHRVFVQEEEAREVKVVLLGQTGVGKSSIVLRFVTNQFDKNSDATIGYDPA